MPPMSKKQQIVEYLLERIRSGELRPGDQLPTSPELSARFNASLTPIRDAIDELKIRGYVKSVHGVGVFVAGEPPH